MTSQVVMSDRQHVSAGITVFDTDSPPKPFASTPPGASVTFVSDHPEIADFAPDETGLNGDVSSGVPGIATITATFTDADGTQFQDALIVTVQNSAPGGIAFTVGTPQDEA